MRIDSLPTSLPRLTLDEALDQFLLHQRSSRHSPRTIEGYEYVLSKMNRWFASQGLQHLDDVDPDAIRRYIAQMQETVSSGTIVTVHRRIKAFFMFHAREENLEKNPIVKVKPPKEDRELLPAFTDDEIRTLLGATAGRDPISIRNRALITLMLDSGLRLKEVADLKVGSVCPKSGVIHVKLGKGGKDRITKIGTEALKAYARYARVRGGGEGAALWLGERGPMSDKGIAETLQKLGKRCGVHCHPHKFRRTCALMMLRKGCSIYTIQKLFGHSDASLSILRRYLAQTEADVTLDHERYSPLDNLG